MGRGLKWKYLCGGILIDGSMGGENGDTSVVVFLDDGLRGG